MSTDNLDKVMLVEDDPAMQSLLRTLLELEGFQVLMPGDQPEDELVETIKTEAPAVILLDVHLRSASGIEILRKLREDGTRSFHPRVIMTSGMDMEDTCMDIGADGFLLKPYMPSELIRRLRGL